MSNPNKCNLSCICCLANKKGARNIKGHRFYRQSAVLPFWRYLEMLRKEARGSAETGSGPSDFLASKWAQAHPSVAEYLTQDKWEDGSARELSTLSIKVQDSGILAVLNDVDSRRSLYVFGTTFEAALKSLEGALAKPGADWRAWSQKGKKKG